MEWRDEAIILSARPHGETSLILQLLTREHGRHAGLVRGARRSRGGRALSGQALATTGFPARRERAAGGRRYHRRAGARGLFPGAPCLPAFRSRAAGGARTVC